MTWALASLLGLGAVLVTSFVWYERTRPSSRVVALVATLAALAALGRIAFAPLPNVKPTTDIVLMSGYALGGAPGAVVGALAALTSNFFFGQGPWTPWQMGGWAACGLVGAGLALISRRRLGRLRLAAACGAAGFAFTALQDFGDWVSFSNHSLAALTLTVGRGIGFDIVHAAGCVAFALLLGPSFASSLERFARRLTFTWAAPGLITLALLSGLTEPQDARAAAATPLSYLLAAQNRDGGFGPAPGQGSSSVFSGWAAIALAADGVRPPGTLRAYLTANPGGRGAGDLERTILALRACGSQVPQHLLDELRHQIGPAGAVAQQVNLTAFAVLAIRSGAEPVPVRMSSWLAGQQNADGGFGFAAAPAQSDVDDTGAVLEALRRAPGRALVFLRSSQNRDGGFPSTPGDDSNAQSTAFAVQGLIAAGVDPRSLRRAGHDPLGYLRGLIAPDGHVRYSAAADQTPVWVTAQAAAALAGKALPLSAPAPLPVAPRPPAAPATVVRNAQPDALAAAAAALLALLLAPAT